MASPSWTVGVPRPGRHGPTPAAWPTFARSRVGATFTTSTALFVNANQLRFAWPMTILGASISGNESGSGVEQIYGDRDMSRTGGGHRQDRAAPIRAIPSARTPEDKAAVAELAAIARAATDVKVTQLPYH